MRVALPVSAILALVVCCGCAYRLGPTNGLEAGSASVQINPFINDTLQPRLGDAVTEAVRKNVQRDGTFRLSTHGDADLVVNGSITHYVRNELSFVPNDVLTVRDFRITATALVSAREVATGKVTTNSVTGYTLVRVGSDLTSAERQALPLLADDLAKKVTAMLVDGTW